MARRPEVVARLPEEPGVYRFRDGADRTLYVGRAVNLRRRVGSYWGDLRDRGHLARMIPRIARVEALVCDSEHEAAWAERNLLEHELPRWNRTRGGEESPVHIRLDTSSASPGLRTAFRPDGGPHVRVFGPYLGGRKVRTAVAALQRVFPVAFCGALTPAGRDLARSRGEGVAPLAEPAAAVAAVLERDPVAVAALLTELERRRDAAATELRFELAGRIQDELHAVEWVVAPQRVTVLGGGDVDPWGWAGGLAVRFAVRGGRLCAWECGPTPREGVGVRGPRAWSAFVRRNAELAAELADRPVA